MPNILIVEDQLRLSEVLRIVMEDKYAVKTAGNGEEALEIMASWAPDVVIADFAMPGMNGIDLIKMIAVQTHKPRVILLSARMDEDMEREALAAGASACLAKPFDLIALRMLVQKNLDI